jgi:hypothetical protein
MAHVRTVTTASGATAVQIVYSTRSGSRTIEHLGSAQDEKELAALKAAARQRLAHGQGVLDLGLDAAAAGSSGPLPIVSSRVANLWDALCRAYEAFGFDEADGGDAAFRDLVLAPIIEPTSKLDSLRVLSEVGICRLARLGRDEPLDEVGRGLRDLLPAVVDGQRVAAVGHLVDLGDAWVVLLPLVGGVCDRPGNRVVFLPVEDQQRATIWVLRVDLRLGPGVEVGVAHLGQGDPRPGHVAGLEEALRLALIEGIRPAVCELAEGERDRAASIPGFNRKGPLALSVETGSGRTPRNTPGSMATVAAESPRPASIWANNPPVKCPITAGFFSSAPITSAV